MKDNLKELKIAIMQNHGVKSRFIKSVPISETFKGEKVWEGVVNVFELQDHPTAKICFAWSYPIEGSKKHRFYTVLESPPIVSPRDAVRATIIHEYREKTPK
jgi:hypothetical protein